MMLRKMRETKRPYLKIRMSVKGIGRRHGVVGPEPSHRRSDDQESRQDEAEEHEAGDDLALGGHDDRHPSRGDGDGRVEVSEVRGSRGVWEAAEGAEPGTSEESTGKNLG
jgi:hypothetical protein